jgi:F420 biosynthesis protein FbiB-like protein
MELHGLIRSRRSVRRFTGQAVSRATIQRILQTASHAPSAHNRQPWRFAVLAKPASKADLATAMAVDYRRDLAADGLPGGEVEARLDRSGNRIKQAPVVVVLCMDTSEMDTYPDARRAEAEHVMAIQSTANSALALLLAVHAEGLGAAWSCAPLFAAAAVKAALNLPSGWEPQALFLIGHPAEKPKPRARKPLQDIVIFR